MLILSHCRRSHRCHHSSSTGKVVLELKLFVVHYMIVRSCDKTDFNALSATRTLKVFKYLTASTGEEMFDTSTIKVQVV